MHHWKIRLPLTALALLSLTFAIACGGSSKADNTATATTTSSGATGTTAASGASGSSAAAAAPTATPKPVSMSFQLDWIPNIQHFGPVYADKMGYYKEAGLTVKILDGGQGIDPINLVVGGGADVGVSNATNIYAANEKGADLVGFAAVYQKSASVLLCRGDKGITKFTDIAGHTIGSKGPNDDTTLPLLLQTNGVDPSSVKIKPIGASSVTEIIAGVVDCQLAYAVNEPITLKKAGIDPVLFNLSDYGFGGQGEIYFTRRDFFNKNQDALVRFVQATAHAWADYLDDPAKAASWLVHANIVDGLDEGQQQQQAIAQATLIDTDFTKAHGLLYLNDDLWKAQAQQALDQKRITKIPDLDTARSFAILDAAKLAKR